MKVQFCDYDGGNELLEVERTDISDLFAILNSQNGKVLIQHNDDEYFYGSFAESTFEMLVNESTDERVEVLKLYFAKELRNVSIHGNVFPRRAVQNREA